jgi:hypothetical protein
LTFLGRVNQLAAMKQIQIKQISFAIVAAFACGTLWAQSPKVAPSRHSSAILPYNDMDAPAGEITIFTNFGPSRDNLYNVAAGGYYVSGPASALGVEQSISIPFQPKGDCHAVTLRAAIGYDSGTKSVNLGIYSDAGGVVGSLLAQASTSKIPPTGECCQLVEVTLAEPGVALTAGTSYWLVATPGADAPDFEGVWQASNRATLGYEEGQTGWFSLSALWPAGAVKGSVP